LSADGQLREERAMALDDETIKRIEEFKEAGQEQRYREQLMVQEFSFSMVAMTLLINALNGTLLPAEKITVQFFGLLFLILLILHLRYLGSGPIKYLADQMIG
jgi:hypothetical protein